MDEKNLLIFMGLLTIIGFVGTFIFSKIIKTKYSEDAKRGIHTIKIFMACKFVFYFLSDFVLALSLKRWIVYRWMVVLIWSYMVLLLAIDCLILLKDINRYRKVSMTKSDYIKVVVSGCIVDIFPALCYLLLDAFDFFEGHTVIRLCIYVMVINLAFPVLTRFKYRKSKKVDTDFFTRIGEKKRKYIAYVYDGEFMKEANAMVCGITPPHHLYISNYLLNNLNEDEVDAVICHEIGHIKKFHLFIKTAILMADYGLVVCFGAMLDKYFSSVHFVISLSMFLAFGVFLALMYKWVARMQECQADRYAVIRTRKPEAMIRALEKFEELNMKLAGKENAGNLLATHPGLKRRVEKIRKIKLCNEIGKRM